MVEGDLVAAVGRRVSLVGHEISTVGFVVSLVGEPFPLVGESFPLVGLLFALVGEAVALVCLAFAQVGESFPFVWVLRAARSGMLTGHGGVPTLFGGPRASVGVGAPGGRVGPVVQVGLTPLFGCDGAKRRRPPTPRQQFTPQCPNLRE